MLFHISACTYFRVKSVTSEDLPKLIEMEKVHKYFVLHQGAEQHHLVLPAIEENILKGTLVEVGSDSIYYNDVRRKLVGSGEKSILNEVHLYLAPDQGTYAVGDIALPVTQISEIRVIKPDTGKSIAHFVFGAIGVLAIVTIIVALTKSSCPYLYVYDGQDYVFEGELYGGAILKNLERDDYLPLPRLQADGSIYKLKIANELKEEEYTNLARLVVVDHPQHTTVLLDQKGQPHLIQDPQLPVQALANGEDIRSTLQRTDRDVYLFDHTEATTNAANLRFEKPAGATSGKLVLNAKNSLWFDWVFGEFTKKFGGFYDQWIEKQAALPGAERRQMAIDQEFPLTVSLKVGDEWQLIEHLPTVGPMAARDFVLPIDLSAHEGPDIEIRLQTGFLFWELDYAAMDFTADTDLQVREIAPLSATGLDGTDHTAALSADDDQYLQQLHTGDATELHFAYQPAAEGFTQSAFLHSKGYYKHVRSYAGLPAISELKKFRTPAYFSEFSKALYLQVIVNNGEEVASITQ
ncbi:hypothetical protein CRP01_36485 [Flavilitoribacter nigricans DSM 23189 = NBRC 102662]|uniref:Uncharacterized protein n=2 Tax=Flavilitoribacter TaxID=2762562 RepID=A0A2D0MZK2_FLAN2|nr:hypothetical protein CRP01_36485 [Flavilitoribacter nigricans DSM 23189 = NBRC 102662]